MECDVLQSVGMWSKRGGAAGARRVARCRVEHWRAAFAGYRGRIVQGQCRVRVYVQYTWDCVIPASRIPGSVPGWTVKGVSPEYSLPLG